MATLIYPFALFFMTRTQGEILPEEPFYIKFNIVVKREINQAK